METNGQRARVSSPRGAKKGTGGFFVTDKLEKQPVPLISSVLSEFFSQAIVRIRLHYVRAILRLASISLGSLVKSQFVTRVRDINLVRRRQRYRMLILCSMMQKEIDRCTRANGIKRGTKAD